MRQTVLIVLILGLVARADAPQSEYKKLEGSYVLVSGVKDGKKLSKKTVKEASLVMKANHHTVHVGGDNIKGTHKLDPIKDPKTIDAMDTEGPFAGKTSLGIYKVEADRFMVCFSVPGKPRPTDFKSGSFRHTWKRAKK